MSKVTVLIANRLIRLTGNQFKMLSYPFHCVSKAAFYDSRLLTS